DRILRAQRKRHASGHSARQIPAGRTEDDDGSLSHVLACVIAGSLDDDRGAAVAHREPFTGRAEDERVAAARAVEACVADRRLAWIAQSANENRAAVHALADVVVGVSAQLER